MQHRRLHLDMQLLADAFAHPVHPIAAARAEFLIVRQVMLDALARQIFWQWPAAPLFRLRLRRVRQFRIATESGLDVIGFVTFSSGLLGFVEEALLELLAARRVAMQALQTQLFLKMADALRERLVLSLQRRDLGRVRRDQRLQRFCRGLTMHRSQSSLPMASAFLISESGVNILTD